MARVNKLSFFLVVLCLIQSCVLPEKAVDSLIVKKIKHNPENIRQAAGFAIGQTYSTDIRQFDVNEISDENMRNKISPIGNTITICYDDKLDEAVPDSIVSFGSLTPFGKTEIIYDFAFRQRNFPNETTSRKDYYFIKVTDRIYYKRSLLP